MSHCASQKSPSRLLIVVPIYGSYRAFLRGASARLIEQGWEVHVASNMTGADVLVDDATLHHVSIPRGGNPIGLLQSARSLRRIIGLLKPDIVHAHFSVGILVAALASPVQGVCFVGTYQGLRFPLARGLAKLVFKIAECFSIWRLHRSWVLTADDYNAVPEPLRNKLRIQPGYGFGCDVSHYSVARFSTEERLHQRKCAEICADDFVFIFVGRLTAFKGYPLVLQAFNRLCSVRRDVSLVVVGEQDPLHPIGLTGMSSNHKVYHLGWKDDPAPMLLMADAMVFPSAREGVPVCVMEALSMELPVVLSDSRGCRELADLTRSNLVLSELSSEAVFEEMLDILQQPKPRTECFKEVRMKVDREHFYEHLRESYEELLG